MQDIKDNTIPYEDDSSEFNEILTHLRCKSASLMAYSLHKEEILDYLSEERLITYMRNYHIDQII